MSAVAPSATSWRVYVVCLFAAIGGFCFGYDTGVLSVSFRLSTLILSCRWVIILIRFIGRFDYA